MFETLRNAAHGLKGKALSGSSNKVFCAVAVNMPCNGLLYHTCREVPPGAYQRHLVTLPLPVIYALAAAAAARA
jgi:hypothetical protein